MNFPRGKWKRIDLYIKDLTKDFIEEFAGIYIIWDRNSKECLYIGSSKNVRSRLINHLVTKKELKNHKDMYGKVRKDKYHFEHLTLEARLICRLRPKYNKSIKGLGIKTISLKRLIKEPDVKQMLKELKPLFSGKKEKTCSN